MMPPATSPTGSTAPQAGLLSPRHTSQPSPAAGLMTDPAMPKVNIEAAFRAEVTEKLRRMSEGTAYDVLDVQPTASVDALRNAYVRLTKLYHPDRTATFQDDNLREQAFEVQRRLVTAWEAVKDPRARQDYDASNLSGPVDDGGGKPDIIKADFNFQRGKACLGKGDAKRGLEFLEVASRQDPHQPLYRIYRGWARFLASDASDIKAKTEAREDIKIALKIDESLDAGYLFLGHISKATANDELAGRPCRSTRTTPTGGGRFVCTKRAAPRTNRKTGSSASCSPRSRAKARSTQGLPICTRKTRVPSSSACRSSVMNFRCRSVNRPAGSLIFTLSPSSLLTTLQRPN